MRIPQEKFITEQEYLYAERVSLDKHKYYKGEVFAMSGASIPHNKVFSNLFGNVYSKSKGKPCQPFGSDLRILTHQIHYILILIYQLFVTNQKLQTTILILLQIQL